MNCKKCGSANLRFSQKKRWTDPFQRLIGREAIRCRKCRLRFYVFRNSTLAKELAARNGERAGSSPISRGQRRRRIVKCLIVIAVFALAFGLFWLFLRYITTEHVPSEDSGSLTMSARSLT